MLDGRMKRDLSGDIWNTLYGPIWISRTRSTNLSMRPTKGGDGTVIFLRKVSTDSRNEPLAGGKCHKGNSVEK